MEYGSIPSELNILKIIKKQEFIEFWAQFHDFLKTKKDVFTTLEQALKKFYNTQWKDSEISNLIQLIDTTAKLNSKVDLKYIKENMEASPSTLSTKSTKSLLEDRVTVQLAGHDFVSPLFVDLAAYAISSIKSEPACRCSYLGKLILSGDLADGAPKVNYYSYLKPELRDLLFKIGDLCVQKFPKKCKKDHGKTTILGYEPQN